MLSALQTFAQDYTTYSLDTTTTGAEAGFTITPVMAVFYVLAYVFFSYLMMRIFVKAKVEPTWSAFVPIYSSVKMLQMVGRPWWWILLMLIPFVGLVFAIIAMHDFSKSFGHGAGFTVLFVLFPIIPYAILAFGSDEYKGPAALEGKGDGAAPSGPITPVA
ncbi:MAG TPA: DUF5684 domain-containing protein [Candidatus Saccharimonadales bacterium]|nr:DUF5684 domain-containing protein [Candidatus Saccharimonadales bacterium]